MLLSPVLEASITRHDVPSARDGQLIWEQGLWWSGGLLVGHPQWPPSLSQPLDPSG